MAETKRVIYYDQLSGNKPTNGDVIFVDNPNTGTHKMDLKSFVDAINNGFDSSIKSSGVSVSADNYSSIITNVNDQPVNSIYTYGAGLQSKVTNLPSNKAMTIINFAQKSTGGLGQVMLAVERNGSDDYLYFRTIGGSPAVWSSWVKVANNSDVEAVREALDNLDIETDKTLSVDGKPADAKATGDEINSLKADLAQYDGIFTGDVDESVQNWLDAHPEATTSVEDHSLTYEKLVNGTLGFVTPEMFGAKGDGVTNDYNSFVNMFSFAFQNNIKSIVCTSDTYKIDDTLTVDGHGIIFDGGFARFIFGKSGFLIAETSYDIEFRNMYSECTFAKGSTGADVIHFGIIGNTTTEKYLAHDIYFKSVEMSGGVMGIATNSAKNIIIENCKFSGFMYKGGGAGGYGILLQSSVDVTIHKCSFNSGKYGRHDIYVSVDPGKTANKSCKNIVIDECYFTHKDLELDGSGYYYSPSTIPIQVRAVIGISISNCEVYSAVGFAVFLGTEDSIVGATAKNIIVDSPVYNSGVSEQKSIISVNGGTYGANVDVNGIDVLNVPSNYTMCIDAGNTAIVKLSNANIGATRISFNEGLLFLNNVESEIDEYFVRFYGDVSGDISNIRCIGLSNPAFKYYIDSNANVNPSIFESKTATLEFTTGSSGGFTNYQDYPDGFYYTMCTVIGIEVYLNGSWRSGNVVSRTSVNTRTFVALESSGIRLFNDEANLYGYTFRITIKQIK